MRLPRPSGLPRRIPALWWKWLPHPASFSAPKPAKFWVWKRWRQSVAPIPKPIPPPKPNIEMYDDVTVSLLPIPAAAYAGYVDGKWPTYAQLVKKFGSLKVHLVSIAVFPSDKAEVLDVEPGDALIAQAAGWIKRMHALGEKMPDVYTALAWAEQLVNALTKAGLVYGKDYRLWTAHYTGVPHLCNPKCGLGFTHIAHATQWTDKAGGKSLDESLCSAEFFA